MSTNFSEIPILDLSLADDPSTKQQLLKELRHILLNIGFLYVKNHGVSTDVIDALVKVLPNLFDIPKREKDSIALEKSPHFLGYSGMGAEKTAQVSDQREQFEFATELESSWVEGDPLYKRLLGPNQWPPSLPLICPVIEKYIQSLLELSTRFLTLVAEALNISSSSLHTFLSPQHRLKVVHYSPIISPGDNQGVGPHKDSSGWWTFLLQASPPHIRGLQAMNRSGAWIDVPNIPGTFVVNIGQAFEVATNGVCPATIHRVLSSEYDRYSIPFFQGVRGDATKKDFEALWPQLKRQGRKESKEGQSIDSPFLSGKYDTWGESQLRTKVRSHRDAGKKFYGPVYEKYINDSPALDNTDTATQLIGYLNNPSQNGRLTIGAWPANTRYTALRKQVHFGIAYLAPSDLTKPTDPLSIDLGEVTAALELLGSSCV
ncbi:oxidoreductase [Sclerotinia borealis F-4128]|uniref:Oxidoreductase n=1 Tax=Sclerotinia borealis (strain F-4128) TaxID=1432307 RepID=W9C521_SCLBF|nr:oxidoreductase [Sclerotinia borealis F-4128]